MRWCFGVRCDVYDGLVRDVMHECICFGDLVGDGEVVEMCCDEMEGTGGACIFGSVV